MGREKKEAPKRAPRARKAKAAAPVVTDAHIAERAYHLWLAGHEGGQLEHWLAAERELATPA